ncbi:hypothetical protein D3C73_952240 [compost metagenome]
MSQLLGGLPGKKPVRSNLVPREQRIDHLQEVLADRMQCRRIQLVQSRQRLQFLLQPIYNLDLLLLDEQHGEQLHIQREALGSIVMERLILMMHLTPENDVGLIELLQLRLDLRESRNSRLLTEITGSRTFQILPAHEDDMLRTVLKLPYIHAVLDENGIVEYIVGLISNNPARTDLAGENFGNQVGQRIMEYAIIPLPFNLGARDAYEKQNVFGIDGDAQLPLLGFTLNQMDSGRNRGGQHIVPETSLHQIFILQPGLPQFAVFAHQRLLLECLDGFLHRSFQLLLVQRFDQIRIGIVENRLGREGEARMTGQEYEPSLILMLPGPLDHIHPGASGHFNITDNQIGLAAIEDLLRFLYVISGQHLGHSKFLPIYNTEQSMNRRDIIIN